MPSSLRQKVWVSSLGPVKLNTVLPTARHRCDISAKVAVLPGTTTWKWAPTNSIHALAYYSKCNERFDLIFIAKMHKTPITPLQQ